MSVDQRLRRGLRSAADGIEPDHRAPLTRVEARARRAARTSWWRRATLAAAVAVLTVAAVPPVVDRLTATPAPAPRPDVASELNGTYVADVPDTPQARAAGLVGRWVITFGADGVLDLNPPPDYTGSTVGTAYEVEGDLLRSDALIDHPGCQTGAVNLGTYRWTRTDGRLRLVTISDGCAARVVLFTGQSWSAAPR